VCVCVCVGCVCVCVCVCVCDYVYVIADFTQTGLLSQKGKYIINQILLFDYYSKINKATEHRIQGISATFHHIKSTFRHSILKQNLQFFL
jgi:hypothetical protein